MFSSYERGHVEEIATSCLLPLCVMPPENTHDITGHFWIDLDAIYCYFYFFLFFIMGK